MMELIVTNCSKIHFKNQFYKELTPHYSMYVRRIY